MTDEDTRGHQRCSACPGPRVDCTLECRTRQVDDELRVATADLEATAAEKAALVDVITAVCVVRADTTTPSCGDVVWSAPDGVVEVELEIELEIESAAPDTVA